MMNDELKTEVRSQESGVKVVKNNGQPIRQAQGGRTTHSTNSGQAGHGPICIKCKSHNTEKRGNSIKCLDCGAETLNV